MTKLLLIFAMMFAVQAQAQKYNTYPIPVKAQAFYPIRENCVSIYKETRLRVSAAPVERVYGLYTIGACPIITENDVIFDKTFEIPVHQAYKIATTDAEKLDLIATLKDRFQDDATYYVTNSGKTERLPEKRLRRGVVKSVIENMPIKAIAKEKACLVFMEVPVTNNTRDYVFVFPQSSCPLRSEKAADGSPVEVAVDFEKIKYLTRYSHISQLEKDFDKNAFYASYDLTQGQWPRWQY